MSETIHYVSGAKLRIRKDGQPDLRYTYGKKLATQLNGKPRVGKAIPRRPKKRESLSERILNWICGKLFILMIAGVIWQIVISPAEAMDASLYVTPTPRPESVLESNLVSKKAYLENPVTIQETLDYIRYKFGDNYKVACMVAYSEGLVSNWVNSTPYERSVGTYQINLADNFGQGTRIHWNKVPGETLEEKEAWLKVRKNNVDLAYTMSDGGESWHAWGGYTNGSYLKHEDKCL